MRVLSRAPAVLLAVCLALMLAGDALFAQMEFAYTYEFPGEGWNSCYGFNADPATSGTSPLTVEMGTFTDPLPRGAVIRRIVITQVMGNGRLYAWMGVPSVSMAMNATTSTTRRQTGMAKRG